jgi:dihydropyrimidine dehydrogenase (NAD+) subunit PreT
MTENSHRDGLHAHRLPPEEIAANFADLHPPLDPHEAQVAADRCYFCYDAPCVEACPTSIDIPLFIRQIQADRPDAAARTIFEQNILGGMCARVCPTEILCEGACVREAAEGRPVEIGRLQRYATDTLMRANDHPFRRAAPTGRRVAVVGAGPAGLACAHGLARRGHDVTVFDARAKPGGLNEYGIAAYKTVGGFAQAEVDWLMQIGGITVETGRRLGDGLDLDMLRSDFDAVFLGVGLAGVNALNVEGGGMDGVRAAVDFIAELRQASDLASLPVGRDVVVIGGGMTAIDAAVQAKRLGAETVTLVYRRGRDRMGASRYEQELAASSGVTLKFAARPVRIAPNGAGLVAEFERTEDGPDGLRGTGETFSIPADQVFKAIGQTLEPVAGLELVGGKIAVTGPGRTSRPKVWAGGDCAAGGDDLTVTAVAEGRDAAEDIHARLMES